MAKVLIVEDEDFLLKMYSKKFTNNGFTVETAVNGKEGLEKMRSFHPDIVLMDIMMPIMDGYDALERMKKDPDLAGTPVVILTNLSQGEDIEMGLKKGAVGHFVKSNFTPAELVEKTKEILSKPKS